jgi:hypothetical protein
MSDTEAQAAGDILRNQDDTVTATATVEVELPGADG